MQKFSLTIATMISGLLLSSCDQSPSNSAKRKSHPQQVSIETINPQSSVLERRFNALIVAPNTITISNQIAGTIVNMPYKQGHNVNKGDILVELDSRLTQAEQLKATASLEKARQDLIRIRKLIPKQLASAEQLTAAITEKKLAEAELTLKNLQLERSIIKAPFNGVISQRHLEPGNSVSINTALLTLVEHDNLIVKSAVPETFISHIKTDKTVSINVPALGLQIPGKVSVIYPTVDSSTQQISTEVSFENSYPQLLPGIFAELIIQYQTDASILIPVNAVQYDTTGSWVYAVDSKQKARQRKIKTGQNINDKIEVISGLKKDDKIITKGFIGLRPGKTIKTDTDMKHKNAN